MGRFKRCSCGEQGSNLPAQNLVVHPGGTVDNHIRCRFLFSIAIFAILAETLACSGGSTLNVKNPSANQGQTVTIAFEGSPLTSIPVNGTAQLIAVVQNDPSNGGVDWSL